MIVQECNGCFRKYKTMPNSCRICGYSQFTEREHHERGLKDHEIQELVNLIHESVQPLTKHQCLRGRICEPVVKYLTDKGMRIDDPRTKVYK